MKKTHKTKNITCRIVSTGTVMQVNTIDEILSPGHYKIDACGVTTNDGFPDGVEGECLSAYLEVSDTNHSADNLKSAAVGQTLTYTNADGDTAVYHRSGTNKNNRVEWSAWSDTAAVGLQNGSITASKLSKDVRTKIDNPLRSLFIAAGAEYNGTGADITKTAPWGETVTHKAGHYYLNGLGDITEEEMMEIYNAGRIKSYNTALLYENNNQIRTTLSGKIRGIQNNKVNFWYICSGCENLIVFNHYNGEVYISTIHAAFINCRRLQYVIPIFNVSNVAKEDLSAFGYCSNLKGVKLKSLMSSLNLQWSPYINLESILFIIQKAEPVSEITITLHASAYARLSNDEDVLAALTEQPLVSLVSV